MARTSRGTTRKTPRRAPAVAAAESLSKGAQTKERILERAFRLATRDGLEGLTIGTLATDMGLSKSGLFAHFGSKEGLQVEVLRAAAQRFTETVLVPAFKAPRGEPRIRTAFQNWLAWVNEPGREDGKGEGRKVPGGCIFIAAATELDDREGPPREFLVASQKELFATLAKAARIAVEQGHFRSDLDPDQFAYELFGIVFSYQHAKRLLRSPRAEARARAAFERLLDSSRVPQTT